MVTPSNITDGSTEAERPFAPRTPRIIGRKEHINAIREAIADDAGRSHVLYFVGSGGIGKTRILEEVGVIQKEWTGEPFRWSKIIDLYHAEYHSPSGLRQAIADGLDPDNHYFQGYRELRGEFEKKRREGIVGRELEELRHRLDVQFQKDYKGLGDKHRLVLCFDTLELLQYESDIVQEVCQVADVDTVIKTWLLEQVGRFPNTVTIFAGRPRPQVQADFEHGFKQAGCVFKLFELGALNRKETQAYLKALSEQRLELAEILQPDVRNRIFQITQGRPIYLTLLIDLLLHGPPLGQIFPAAGEATQEVDEALVGTKLVENLMDLPDPVGQMIYFLVHARKGLDANLLRHLVGGLWSDAEMKANLARMGGFAFVRTRPGIEQLFLHDEVYDLFDRYFRDDPRYGREFESIAQYYRERRDAAPAEEREELTVTLLYYEHQVDARAGYHKFYARWDEEAIMSHETGLDMRLRDESLRFHDRYANPESPFYDPRVADRVDRAAIDRDCAVRWVKRYLVRGEFVKASQVAERLRYSEHPTFNWDTADDPLYKAGLLAAWGEALVYTGAPEGEARSTLEQAVQLLEDGRDWTEDQRWRRACILGRAYNDIGYLHRTRGRYGLALQQYRRAFPYFGEADIPDERADTLNNLAFLLALLGRVSLARRHVERALVIRERIGREYPIALSRNTRGLIHTLQDHPMWGEHDCREALRICEELQDPRGIGLACNGLGFALRKRGDQWKLGVYSQEEAERHFQEAVQCFQRAAEIFSDRVSEPIRLWEAYNELGSLYCDWGWLTRHRAGDRTALGQLALEQYARSIEYQSKALKVAEGHNLPFQVADSYDDLAQVYGDRSFLLAQMGEMEESKKSRATAESYLGLVEQKMVPKVFHLVPGQGFRQAPEPGEAYWLSLGKVHLWRGIWGFRDLETGLVPDQEREDALRKATRHLILAVAYFQHYWPASFAYEHALDYFSHFLQAAGVSADWAHGQVRAVASEYQVNLEVLEETVDDMLGL